MNHQIESVRKEIAAITRETDEEKSLKSQVEDKSRTIIELHSEIRKLQAQDEQLKRFYLLFLNNLLLYNQKGRI